MRSSRRRRPISVWLVRKDAHSGLANAGRWRSRAWSGRPAFPRGSDEADRRRGARRSRPRPDFLAAQRDAMQLGITGVHDAMVDEDYLRLLRSLEDGRSLRLRVHAMFWHENPDRVIEFMKSRSPRRAGSRSARSSSSWTGRWVVDRVDAGALLRAAGRGRRLTPRTSSGSPRRAGDGLADVRPRDRRPRQPRAAGRSTSG
jgi:hypothetical protein